MMRIAASTTRTFQVVAVLTTLSASVDTASAATHSSSIVVSSDGLRVWSVNPDVDTVSVFETVHYTKLGEISVGDNPQSVALNSSGATAYVVNQGSDTVSVIDTAQRIVVDTVRNVGFEPYGAALTPDGKFLYVACASSANVYKIDVGNANQILQTITVPGARDLRGVAISDDSQTVYVTEFLAEARPDFGDDLIDDVGKQGVLYPINVTSGSSDTVGTKIALLPLADSGFTADRSRFCVHTAGANPLASETFCPNPNGNEDPNDPLVKNDPQGTYQNVIQNVVIVGNRAIIPSLGTSPEPPVRFNVNVQALVSVVNLTQGAGTFSKAVNLNVAVKNEVVNAAKPLNKVFFSMPWALEVHPNPTNPLDVGYMVVQGGNMVVKLYDVRKGNPTVVGPVGIVRIPVGKDPRGIAISPGGTRGYVQNLISRSVTVLNLTNDTVFATMQSSALPAAGSDAAKILRGKELFNTALGPETGTQVAADGRVPRFAMSDNGWGSCFNCHPFGLADGATWSFPNGPRQTLPLDGTNSQTNQTDQRILNWTAVRTTVQDFEKNTEAVSGGFGLIGPNGATDNVKDHGANRGLSVDSDAIELYVRTIAAPRSVRDLSGDVEAGRGLFVANNCQSCHGGSKWSKSVVAYDLPAQNDPDVEFVGEDGNNPIGTGQVNEILDAAPGGLQILENVGSFNPSDPFEIRGAGNTIGSGSQGAEGFNVPSLLGAARHSPYFHDGRHPTLADVIASGHGGTGGLTPDERGQLASFLKSIDDTTPPVLPDTEIVAFSDHNSPIQLSPDERYVYTANPDNNTMSVVYVAGDENKLVAEVDVGKEPRSVAAHRDNRRIFVANQADGTISVVRAPDWTVVNTIQIFPPGGIELYGLALTRDGKKLLVTDSGSSAVDVIDVDPTSVTNETSIHRVDLPTQIDALSTTVLPAGHPLRSLDYLNPRGIAVTPDGTAAVVTLFLAQQASAATPDRIEGFDSGNSGYAVLLDLAVPGNTVPARVQDVLELPFLEDTGFPASRANFCNGTTPTSDPPNQTFCPDVNITDANDPIIAKDIQSAYPNLLQSVVIVPTSAIQSRVYFPSIGSSPEPPFGFNINIQALVSAGTVGTLATPSLDSYGGAVNLNKGVQFELATQADFRNGSLKRIFFGTLWDLRFKNSDQPNRVGFALSAGSDLAVRVSANVFVSSNDIALDPAPPASASTTSPVVRVKLGKNPRGLAITASGARMYSYNEVGHSVTAVNISNDLSPVVIGEVVVARKPDPNSPAGRILLGKELFNTGLGPLASDPNFAGRFTMSDNGWGSCFNCHPNGLADGATWIFANGPRQTIPLDSTFSKLNRTDQRVLNWTAVRSSVQDFEKNTENVSGGFGLIGIRGGDGVVDHGANRGLDPRADSINDYVKSIRSPRVDKGLIATTPGRAIFNARRCWACHGSAKWSSSFVNYSLPQGLDPSDTDPFVAVDSGGQVLNVNGVPVLRPVNTFDATGDIEIKQNGTLAQGANGFNPPSLLGLATTGPYFHDGRHATLTEVVDDPHMNINPDGIAFSNLSPTQKSQLRLFLRTIDETTSPFPVSPAFAAGTQPRSNNSSPIASTADGEFVVAVNHDNNSVTVINATSELALPEFLVGKGPRSVVIDPRDTGPYRVYVTNQKEGTAQASLGTVWALSLASDGALTLISIISVGAEPYGAALSPNGKFLFVTNFSSGTLSVIRTDSLTVARTLDMKTSARSVPYPAGVAVTNDGDLFDDDEKVYVTLFLAQLSEGGGEGFDQGKEGHVVVLDIGAAADASDLKIIRTLRLPGMQDTGFTADRTKFRVDNGAVNNTFAGTAAEPQAGFPNLLQSVFMRGNRAYLASLGSQPEPPVRFDVNVQAFLSTVDTFQDTAVQPTINLNQPVKAEAAPVATDPDDLRKLFFSAPWQFAALTTTSAGYTVVSGSDVVVKVDLDDLGQPTLSNPIKRIQVGKNPQGIVILPANDKAYVLNAISRSVSIINLTSESVTNTVQIAALPASGSQAEKVLLGKELFNSSRGGLAPDPNFQGRFHMSSNGWGSCFNCHPFGLSDGVTWIFADGPRQTIPLDGTFGADDATTGKGGFIPGLTQRILNYGAVRSTVQDFEKNTENVSGGFGLIGVNGGDDLVADHKANRGLNARADAIETYVATILAPISPQSPGSNGATEGRQIFIQAGCDKCHSGSIWSTSRADYTLPASADTDVVFSNNTARSGSIVKINNQTRGFLPILFDVGTFNQLPAIEIRGLGGQIGKTAGGADGFNSPSLLGIAAQAPYWHDGSARDLEEVMQNVEHRTAGQTTPVDIFAGPSGAANIAKVVTFMKSVSELTTRIQQPAAIEIVRSLAPVAFSITALAIALLSIRRLRSRRRVGSRGPG